MKVHQVASGFGFGSVPKYFDLEPGRRCQTAGQSGVRAGSKPDDGKRKAVFACRRRTCAQVDEVGMARRRPLAVKLLSDRDGSSDKEG